MRKYSFSKRVIHIWNKLSNDCVNAGSVNMSNNTIDRYLIRVGYTYMITLSTCHQERSFGRQVGLLNLVMSQPGLLYVQFVHYCTDASLQSRCPQESTLNLDWTGVFASNSTLVYEINIGMKRHAHFQWSPIKL